jgi:hypothetical protein
MFHWLHPNHPFRAPTAPALALALLLATAAAAAAAPPSPAALDSVVVIVDMDPNEPGVQHEVWVGATGSLIVVEDIAIYIYDPLAQRSVWAIGYVGGIDRGIAFGHVADNQYLGEVVELVPEPGVPVNPGNMPIIWTDPALDKGFPGPEVQYIEAGAAGPSVIGPPPGDPVFTVDVVLDRAGEGDEYDFYLLDFVAVWAGGGHGAFSTLAPLSLDTGGDAVADSTRTLHGVDPDSGVAVPPAAFRVDLIDGRLPGPARIILFPICSIASPGGDAPAARRLEASFPNPFDRLTSVRYEIPAGAAMRLAVYDVRGRLTRVVESSPACPAGAHTGTWDGRDEEGRRVPPGLYFWRLEAGPLGESRPIVLAR